MNRSSPVLDVEHLRPEALAVALVARHEHVSEELHLDPNLSLAFARLAAAAGDVEREVARRQAASTRVLGRRKQIANRIERFEVGDRVRPRRPSDWRLIDEHDVADELRAFERLIAA